MEFGTTMVCHEPFLEINDAALPLRVESSAREADYVCNGVLSVFGFGFLGFCLVVLQRVTTIWCVKR